jgi:hypothetical protein
MTRANAQNASEGSIMKIKTLVYAGFAAAAFAGVSAPALAWTVWPDIDFEWYADVGRTTTVVDVEVMPAARVGYIWAPGRWEAVGSTRERFVGGHWIKDDYYQQVIAYNNLDGATAFTTSPVSFTTYTTSPVIVRDRFGEIVLPPEPANYPIDFK